MGYNWGYRKKEAPQIYGQLIFDKSAKTNKGTNM